MTSESELTAVLPPIPTTGLTFDDVSSLTESTREAMLKALKEISRPVPAATKTAAAIETSVSKATALEKIRGSEQNSVDQLLVASAQSDATSEAASRDTTEDELDGDAVLLKRPKAD